SGIHSTLFLLNLTTDSFTDLSVEVPFQVSPHCSASSGEQTFIHHVRRPTITPSQDKLPLPDMKNSHFLSKMTSSSPPAIAQNKRSIRQYRKKTVLGGFRRI
ncbi:hypothetical protein PIB30_072467, partial [Stylosanthes scabra]|nr:hypothetical protein [Stylosanthes scabra]